jgi:hypothetical protein
MLYILCDQCASSGSLVLECRRDLLLGLVVPSEAVDAGFDKDKTEFRVLVFSVDFEVLADGDSFLDEVPQVLRNRGSKSYSRHNCESARVNMTSGTTQRWSNTEGYDEEVLRTSDLPCAFKILKILLPVTNRT